MVVLPRLLDDLEQFSKIGHGLRGTTRLAYTEDWMRAQMLAKRLLDDSGLETSIDSVGNLTAYRKGEDAGLAPVAIGSHLDTVPDGGNFDGVLGVASAIEVARTLHEDKVELKRGLQVISFACEEASRFGVGCVGSKYMVGEAKSDLAEKLHDATGSTLKQCLHNAKLSTNPSNVKRKGDFSAYVELHIEQGPVLEKLSKPIGVVTGIAAPTRLLVNVTGKSGHVGTVPMNVRKDALVTAAEIISGLEDVVRRTDEIGVGTVGKLEVQPNTVTAIPGHVKLWIDLRYINEDSKNRCVAEIRKLIANIARKRELKIETELLTDDKPVTLSPRIIEIIKKSANSFGYDYNEMPSGAGHDAAHMASITDVGMIFIPCKDGISHAQEEYADPHQLEAGLNVLYKTIVNLAGE